MGAIENPAELFKNKKFRPWAILVVMGLIFLFLYMRSRTRAADAGVPDKTVGPKPASSGPRSEVVYIEHEHPGSWGDHDTVTSPPPKKPPPKKPPPNDTQTGGGLRPPHDTQHQAPGGHGLGHPGDTQHHDPGGHGLKGQPPHDVQHGSIGLAGQATYAARYSPSQAPVHHPARMADVTGHAEDLENSIAVQRAGGTSFEQEVQARNESYVLDTRAQPVP